MGSMHQSLHREVKPTNSSHVLLTPPHFFLLIPTILYWWVYGSVRLGSPLTPLKITCVRAPHMLLVSNCTLSIASAEEGMTRRRKVV